MLMEFLWLPSNEVRVRRLQQTCWLGCLYVSAYVYLVVVLQWIHWCQTSSAT